MNIVQNHFRKIVTPVLLVLAIFYLQGCTVNPATGEQSFTAFMSPEREKEVGAQEHPKILKQFGGAYDNVEVGAYVAQIGGSLARFAELPDLQFTFTVLNDEAVNAFALPGGYVYITRGLMAIAADEAELAGVLSHEIGHITARHTAQRYSAAMATNIGLQVLGVIGSVAGAPTGSGSLASLGAQMALQSYSREQELESDMLGVRYLSRAGYDPDAMTGFFHKLRAHHALSAAMAGKENTSEKFNILSTHPLTSERITETERLAALADHNGRRRNETRYEKAIDGMTFGDDPSQGIRRGRVFSHPDLGIQFEVPKGFTMINTPQKLIAHGPEDAAIIFDMADPKKVSRSKDMRTYVDKVWVTKVALKDVESININGMAAATGTAQIKNSKGTFDVRPIAIREGDDKVFRLLFLSKPDQTEALSVPFRKSTYSFKRLTKDEAAAIQPLRIRFQTVKAGDTVESLAAEMPIENFGLEWFELLNGIKRGESLEPGSRVRTVEG